MPDETRERRQLWRHLVQCVFAEQQARAEAKAFPEGSRFRARADAALLAEGVRVDAAIDALDESLRGVTS